jgi:hypothetical protein
MRGIIQLRRGPPQDRCILGRGLRAANYHVYIWGPTGSYYQRYYETPSPSLTISTDPVGPVPVPIKLTASDTGGRLKAGNYYFAVSAEFADGGSVDQTNYANFPVATIRRDTGSVAVSWTALSGATAYGFMLSANRMAHHGRTQNTLLPLRIPRRLQARKHT